MNEYQQRMREYDKKLKEKKRYLNPNQFESIFQDKYVHEPVNHDKEVPRTIEEYSWLPERRRRSARGRPRQLRSPLFAFLFTHVFHSP